MEERIKTLNKVNHTKNILYLMRRDQRIYQNHSVNFSYNLSYQNKTKLYILCDYLELKLNEKQKVFTIEGLKEIETDCKKYNIYFNLVENLEEQLNRFNVDCIVLDFSPLRECIEYSEKIKKICIKFNIGLYMCDSHNVIPCWILNIYKRTSKSVKIELYKHWNKYFKKYEDLEIHKFNDEEETKAVKIVWPDLKTIESKSFIGGYKSGMIELEKFFKERFKIYAEFRNKPDYNALSNISPWLHSGQISALQVILIAYSKFSSSDKNLEIFLNEVFVWKETAEHFCYHEKNYDSLKGALVWANESLVKHKNDKRQFVYTYEQFESASTHDNLWNAGQKEMLKTGKMHGYVRMYWAKQILKWSRNPEDALNYAIKLNDTYSLDGNDPNGYLGVMWCICGTMDQGFMEREVMGKIRPMNAFKAPKYVSEWAYK